MKRLYWVIQVEGRHAKEERPWTTTKAFSTVFHPLVIPLAPSFHSHNGEFCGIDRIILEQGHREQK